MPERPVGRRTGRGRGRARKPRGGVGLFVGKPAAGVRLDTTDADLDAACAGLNAGQRAGVHAIFKTARRITIVHGMGGSGKSTMMKLVCRLYSQHVSPRIILASHTGSATVALKHSVGELAGVAVTIMAFNEHADKFDLAPPRPPAPGGPALVVVDEYLMTAAGRAGVRRADALAGKHPLSVWDRFIKTLDRCAPGYTLVVCGDPDQMAPGVRDAARPLMAPDTWLTALMAADAAVPAAERRANYVLLTRQERMAGATDPDVAGFVAAIATVSDPATPAAERTARETVVEFLVGAEARSSAADLANPVSIVAVQGVAEALRINNAAVISELAADDTLFVLNQPAKGAPAGSPAMDTYLRRSGRARVRNNQISDAWRSYRRPAFGTRGASVPRVYDVYNYQEVAVVNVAPPGKPPARPLPRPPCPDTVAVKRIAVGPDTVATVRRPDGDSVDMLPVAVAGGRHALALTGVARPEAGTIALHQAKTYPATKGDPVLFVISIANWDALAPEELWMLITRCRDPSTIRFWPRQGPARIRSKLLATTPRGTMRSAFKRAFAGLALRPSSAQRTADSSHKPPGPSRSVL